MSLTPISGRPPDPTRSKITIASLREQKLRHEPITCLTAYDYSTARVVDEAGIDMVLVGDSLAQTMLGYENTLSVTMEEMLHHVRAVRRGVRNALLVADMPYGSYQIDAHSALANATRFVKEGGAEAEEADTVFQAFMSKMKQLSLFQTRVDSLVYSRAFGGQTRVNPREVV